MWFTEEELRILKQLLRNRLNADYDPTVKTIYDKVVAEYNVVSKGGNHNG